MRTPLLASLALLVACGSELPPSPVPCGGACGAGTVCGPAGLCVALDAGADVGVIEAGRDVAPVGVDVHSGCTRALPTLCELPHQMHRCVDTQTDVDHCGSCSHGCGTFECAGGRCRERAADAGAD